MGIMTMNMSQGNIESNKSASVDYDDEILSSGWNPVIGLSQLVTEDEHRSFPTELANVDLEVFLKNM